MNVNRIAFSFVAAALLLTSACDSSLGQAATVPPRKKPPCKVHYLKIPCPEAPRVDLPNPVQPNVSLNELQALLAASPKMTQDERLSIEWMISVLTNEGVVKKFTSLCADESKTKDLQACIKEAQTKLFGVHSLSRKGPHIFAN
jgi:hypothetical protein